MEKVTGRLTVFFEDSFWVGAFERRENGKLSVAKVIFGAEPKDYQVLEYVLKHYDKVQYSLSVATAVKNTVKSHKKMQRVISKQIKEAGIGTKAQQILKLQFEQKKQERKCQARQQKEAEAEKRFMQKQKKKREKHRGH